MLSSPLPWSSPGDVWTTSGCFRVCWVCFGAVLATSLASCCGQHVMLRCSPAPAKGKSPFSTGAAGGVPGCTVPGTNGSVPLSAKPSSAPRPSPHPGMGSKAAQTPSAVPARAQSQNATPLGLRANPCRA